MKKSRFTDQQIAVALQQVAAELGPPHLTWSNLGSDQTLAGVSLNPVQNTGRASVGVLIEVPVMLSVV